MRMLTAAREEGLISTRRSLITLSHLKWHRVQIPMELDGCYGGRLPRRVMVRFTFCRFGSSFRVIVRVMVRTMFKIILG